MQGPPSDRLRDRLEILFAAFLPGALAGALLAGLLFFLNPHLPFELLPVLRGVVIYGLLLGGATLLGLLPFTWGRRGRARRLLPWSLTLVLAAAGLGVWVHAVYYPFYLPTGINRRLLKAAIWLSLAAVIGFYTALLHRFGQRAYGPRGRTLFALLALASVYVVFERREAFQPVLGPAPRASTFAGSQRPRLVVVGIETATLDAILPLAEQGRLPFLSRMLRTGSYARTSSLRPALHGPLWTTLGTGKYPYQHGVVGTETFAADFLGPGLTLSLLPVGIGFQHWGTWSSGQRVDASSRRSLALWDILSRLGVSTGLVGWPLTYPPPTRVRAVIDDQFFASNEQGSGDVYPRELAERARLFRTRVEELDPALASRFGSQPPAVVLEAVAQDVWRQDLSFLLLDQPPQVDALFVVLPGLGELSRRYFGGFSAVQFEGVQDPVSSQGAQLVTAYYMFLDELLAQLWERIPAPRLLTVVSCQGVESAYGWRDAWRQLVRRPALEGYTARGPDGVLLFLGEGIRAGGKLPGADLVDLAPTLLYSLGFPVARDLDGAVLTSAFETGFLARQPLALVPSYETFATLDGP